MDCEDGIAFMYVCKWNVRVPACVCLSGVAIFRIVSCDIHVTSSFVAGNPCTVVHDVAYSVNYVEMVRSCCQGGSGM